MLEIIILPVEKYDEINNRFFTTKLVTLQMEHSLVSLSKWESHWKIPFLGKQEKTDDQTIDYIRCMTITQNVDPAVFYDLSLENIKRINAYIADPMTATTFSKNADKATNREIITAEIIYWWMFALNIPIEFQKWHLNRLLTLINVCSIKNQPSKKISQKELAVRNASLNKARKEALKTSG